MTYADEINQWLESGYTVIVSTYNRAVQYDKRHTGMFFMQGGNLHVKHGRSSNCLSFGKNLLVSIKAYKG